MENKSKAQALYSAQELKWMMNEAIKARVAKSCKVGGAKRPSKKNARAAYVAVFQHNMF